MAKCELCGKIPSAGNTVSHSNRHTKTKWYPNVHRIRLTIGRRRLPVRVCTRCLRSHHNVRLKA